MAIINNNTPVTATITPRDDQDKYATHDEQYGLGSYRSVADEAERLAIPDLRKKEGMMVKQNDTGLFYVLDADLITWNIKSEIKTWDDIAFGDKLNLFNVDESFIDVSIDDVTGNKTYTETGNEPDSYFGDFIINSDTEKVKYSLEFVLDKEIGFHFKIDVLPNVDGSKIYLGITDADFSAGQQPRTVSSFIELYNEAGTWYYENNEENNNRIEVEYTDFFDKNLFCSISKNINSENTGLVNLKVYNGETSDSMPFLQKNIFSFNDETLNNIENNLNILNRSLVPFIAFDNPDENIKVQTTLLNEGFIQYNNTENLIIEKNAIFKESYPENRQENKTYLIQGLNQEPVNSDIGELYNETLVIFDDLGNLKSKTVNDDKLVDLKLEYELENLYPFTNDNGENGVLFNTNIEENSNGFVLSAKGLSFERSDYIVSSKPFLNDNLDFDISSKEYYIPFKFSSDITNPDGGSFPREKTIYIGFNSFYENSPNFDEWGSDACWALQIARFPDGSFDFSIFCVSDDADGTIRSPSLTLTEAEVSSSEFSFSYLYDSFNENFYFSIYKDGVEELTYGFEAYDDIYFDGDDNFFSLFGKIDCVSIQSFSDTIEVDFLKDIVFNTMDSGLKTQNFENKNSSNQYENGKIFNSNTETEFEVSAQINSLPEFDLASNTAGDKGINYFKIENITPDFPFDPSATFEFILKYKTSDFSFTAIEETVFKLEYDSDLVSLGWKLLDKDDNPINDGSGQPTKYTDAQISDLNFGIIYSYDSINDPNNVEFSLYIEDLTLTEPERKSTILFPAPDAAAIAAGFSLEFVDFEFKISNIPTGKNVSLTNYSNYFSDDQLSGTKLIKGRKTLEAQFNPPPQIELLKQESFPIDNAFRLKFADGIKYPKDGTYKIKNDFKTENLAKFNKNDIVSIRNNELISRTVNLNKQLFISADYDINDCIRENIITDYDEFLDQETIGGNEIIFVQPSVFFNNSDVSDKSLRITSLNTDGNFLFLPFEKFKLNNNFNKTGFYFSFNFAKNGGNFNLIPSIDGFNTSDLGTEFTLFLYNETKANISLNGIKFIYLGEDKWKCCISNGNSFIDSKELFTDEIDASLSSDKIPAFALTIERSENVIIDRFDSPVYEYTLQLIKIDDLTSSENKKTNVLAEETIEIPEETYDFYLTDGIQLVLSGKNVSGNFNNFEFINWRSNNSISGVNGGDFTSSSPFVFIENIFPLTKNGNLNLITENRNNITGNLNIFNDYKNELIELKTNGLIITNDNSKLYDGQKVFIDNNGEISSETGKNLISSTGNQVFSKNSSLEIKGSFKDYKIVKNDDLNSNGYVFLQKNKKYTINLNDLGNIFNSSIIKSPSESQINEKIEFKYFRNDIININDLNLLDDNSSGEKISSFSINGKRCAYFNSLNDIDGNEPQIKNRLKYPFIQSSVNQEITCVKIDGQYYWDISTGNLNKNIIIDQNELNTNNFEQIIYHGFNYEIINTGTDSFGRTLYIPNALDEYAEPIKIKNSTNSTTYTLSNTSSDGDINYNNNGVFVNDSEESSDFILSPGFEIILTPMLNSEKHKIKIISGNENENNFLLKGNFTPQNIGKDPFVGFTDTETYGNEELETSYDQNKVDINFSTSISGNSGGIYFDEKPIFSEDNTSEIFLTNLNGASSGILYFGFSEKNAIGSSGSLLSSGVYAKLQLSFTGNFTAEIKCPGSSLPDPSISFPFGSLSNQKIRILFPENSSFFTFEYSAPLSNDIIFLNVSYSDFDIRGDDVVFFFQTERNGRVSIINSKSSSENSLRTNYANNQIPTIKLVDYVRDELKQPFPASIYVNQLPIGQFNVIPAGEPLTKVNLGDVIKIKGVTQGLDIIKPSVPDNDYSTVTLNIVDITSDYLISSSDNGKVLRFNIAAGSKTLTIPSGLPVGFNFIVTQENVGQVTWVADTGVQIKNVNGHTQSIGNGAVLSFIHTANNVFVETYVVSGDTI